MYAELVIKFPTHDGLQLAYYETALCQEAHNTE